MAWTPNRISDLAGRVALVTICSAATVLLSLSVAGCSRASREPLHLRTSASDYRSLGLTPGKVQQWEDGRRTAPDEKSFEWWYFDALMKDGTAVVVVFSDNFAQDHKRGVSLELTSPDGKHRTFNTKFDEPGAFAKDHTFVQIGENRFEGDLDTYSIKVSADNPQHLGVDLVLKRRFPSFRAATGQLSSGPAYFAWLNAVPSGAVTGTITIGGKATAASGEGYHDHNWGNVPPSDLLDKWWWGRASVGQHRIVTYEIHGKKSVGGTNIGLYYVGTEEGIEVNAVGDQVAVLEGPLIKHPDPNHERPIPASISYAANGTTSNFSISGPMLLSLDLMAEQPSSAKLLASVFGIKPRYSRFQSPVSLSVAGRPIEKGTGILEYYELQ
ncbi:MAG: hypothetical protein ABR905_20870 [Terracidiphilus sp.]|jgi:hypothetical protein